MSEGNAIWVRRENEGDWLDVGDDHFVKFTTWSPDRELNPQYAEYPDVEKWGLIIDHPHKNPAVGPVFPGRRCRGAVTFDGPVQQALVDGRARWQVISLEPETLEIAPSVLCMCGDHGFIRNGRWVAA